MQKLEKGKKDQDLLIDHLHQQVRTQEQQIAIYSQQYESQRRETRAAKEMLAGAEAEMERIHFEKKQLTAQWQSSLIATQRRDEALRVSYVHHYPLCSLYCLHETSFLRPNRGSTGHHLNSSDTCCAPTVCCNQ